MDLITKKIHDICERFILSEHGCANHEMTQLTDLLMKNEELIAKKPGFIEIINKIIKAQSSKNYLYIADLLQYELLPLFNKDSKRSVN